MLATVATSPVCPRPSVEKAAGRGGGTHSGAGPRWSRGGPGRNSGSNPALRKGGLERLLERGLYWALKGEKQGLPWSRNTGEGREQEGGHAAARREL